MADSRESELHRRINQKSLLIAASSETGGAAHAELAGLVGFDLIWLDMEHGTLGWREAQMFSQAALAGGVWPMIRVPSADRRDVLHALDIGAQVVVVPMVNSVETARAVVEHGKYHPLGKRGFAGSTRAVRYGLAGPPQVLAQANLQTHLFVQIETLEAARACREIVGVEGISGGLVGPADLSLSNGTPLAFDDPDFVKLYASAIHQVRSAGKIAATATEHPGLIDAALEAGLQVLVCASELSALRSRWQTVRAEMTAKAGQTLVSR